MARKWAQSVRSVTEIWVLPSGLFTAETEPDEIESRTHSKEQAAQ